MSTLKVVLQFQIVCTQTATSFCWGKNSPREFFVVLFVSMSGAFQIPTAK